MSVTTTTGYRASDKQVAYWQSRDTCPWCDAVVEPAEQLPGGGWAYRHDCAQPAIEWTR